MMLAGRITVHHGDSRDVLKSLADASIDSVVCDPPYALTANKRGGTGVASVNLASPHGRARIGTGNGGAGFMGQTWDTGETAFDPAFWAEVLRVLKPGAFLVAFGGTRTYHRLACAIEDGGFEIQDMLAWLYGCGFPKSHDFAAVPGSKKHGGREVRPEFVGTPFEVGYGTAFKPALEPVCFAQKPISEKTIAANVARWGTGGIWIDGCRVEGPKPDVRNVPFEAWRRTEGRDDRQAPGQTYDTTQGRWPANVMHDGSDEVVSAFPFSDPGGQNRDTSNRTRQSGFGMTAGSASFHDAGSAARFFYSAKADADDRVGSGHPTVKPVDLMAYYARLVTPPGGVVLDPFAGSGSTGEAALREGLRAVLIEREATYVADIERRIAAATGVISRAAAKSNRHAPAKRAGADLPLFMEPENAAS